MKKLGIFCIHIIVLALWVSCSSSPHPEEIPGPPGCGLRDPRDTSPGMLSVAQKTTLQQNGSPSDVTKNMHGGLTWEYRSRQGSTFGENDSTVRFDFDAVGLLLPQGGSKAQGRP
jgi:hypothetical protein